MIHSIFIQFIYDYDNIVFQPLSDTSSTGSPPTVHRNNKNNAYDLTDIPDFQQPNVRPCKYHINFNHLM